MPPILVDSDLKSNLFNTLALKSYELITHLTELLQFSAGQINQIESAVREARHRVRDPQIKTPARSRIPNGAQAGRSNPISGFLRIS